MDAPKRSEEAVSTYTRLLDGFTYLTRLRCRETLRTVGPVPTGWNEDSVQRFGEAQAGGNRPNPYELTRSSELLQQMNVPNLQPYDPAKDEPFPWEADVRVAIEKRKAEKK